MSKHCKFDFKLSGSEREMENHIKEIGSAEAVPAVPKRMAPSFGGR